MKKIVIIGSGGFAKEVAFLIDEINKERQQWDLLGFIDSNIEEFNGKYKTIQNDNWLKNTNEEINVAFGIGSPKINKKIYQAICQNKNIRFPNLIHPNVVGDWTDIKLGKGNLICATNSLTTNISIGDFNIINLNCTIGHDCQIGNFNIMNPSVNISGGVKLSNSIEIGTNATVLQYKNICSNVIIGASSLVTKNITEAGTYVGLPVKKIK